MSISIEQRTSEISSRRNIDNDTGPFLCKICSKPFTKRTSRNRHVLYCRKKLVDCRPVLRKSCAACRKAKAKCDSKSPNCSRCDDRGLKCVYELTKRSANSTQPPALSPPDTPSSDGTFLVEIPEPASEENFLWNTHANNGNDVQTDLALWEPDAGLVEDLQFSNIGADISSLGYTINDTPVNWFIPSPTPGLILDPTFSTPADCMFHTPYLVLRPMDRNRSPTSTRSPFIHTSLSMGSQLGRTFILENLRLYATALATNNLPPFIHSTSLPLSDSSSSQTPTCAAPPPLPTLEICRAIVSLHTTKTAATSSFVWRTIGMEKDRFMKEYLSGDESTVLSMLQAITLYILLRIFDEDSFSVEFDRELIRAMTEIAIQAEQCGLICPAEIEGRRPEWEEWVLVESKRRTVSVLFLLYLLFDIKPEGRAFSYIGLSVLPLPAKKGLWEAVTESEWIQKYDEVLKARAGSDLLRYADLKGLRGETEGDKTKDLQSWMLSTSGDSFGMVVLMAANSV